MGPIGQIGRELFAIYTTALEACDPARLVQQAIGRAGSLPSPVDVVALGKCAAPMLAGAQRCLTIDRAFAAVPHGYPRPDAETAFGSHPRLSVESFEAGKRLLDFVDGARNPTVFLISGGASACVESPLAPWFTAEELIRVNDLLIFSGSPIEKINTTRKHLSAIKGGRLGARANHGAITFIHSDVGIGHEEMVASGPTVADPTTNLDAAEILETLGAPEIAQRLRDHRLPETIKDTRTPILVADNATLVRAAAVATPHSRVAVDEIVGDVSDCAAALYAMSRGLKPHELLIAGGEATVRVTNPEGRGGRCSELALRVATLALSRCDPNVFALFGSSDGVDGTSGAAGAIIDPRRYHTVTIETIERALSECDSARLLDKTGEPIMIPPTGNNLRDLYILARG